jgi:hypothetical protein
MSKGLGKLQKTILGLLDGSLPLQCYRSSGALTTRELFDELAERGTTSLDTPRKTAMSATRRACLSLLDRGHIEGEYTIDFDYPGARIASWRLATRAKTPGEG